MLKRMMTSRATLCTIPLMSVKNHRTFASRYNRLQRNESFQAYKILKKNSCKEAKHPIAVKIKKSHIANVKLLLEKFNVDMDESSIDKSIFVETTYTIEKRIMLLQEMGVSKINISYIVNFIKGMYMPVDLFKANFAIDPDLNVAQNILSYIENPNFNIDAVNHLNENMTMKQYYSACLAYYLKTELDLQENQMKHISYKKYTPVLYNSMRLLQESLKIIKDIPLTVPTILKNKFLFYVHPEYVLTIIKIIKEDLKLSNKALIRHPNIFNCDLDDFRILIKYFKQYEITKKMIESRYTIFQVSSAEFKRRMECLLSNPYTLIYQTHPRFLSLVVDYHIILARLQYLQEKNLKFASIHTLTTFRNYLELLVSKRKINSINLISFLQSQFGSKWEELIEPLKRHTYFAYAPLVQNYETLVYLRTLYDKEIIHKHIYAILYNKEDLQAAHEIIMNDPQYSEWPPDKLLALSVYKIEANCYFTGEAVLEPQKFVSRVSEERVK